MLWQPAFPIPESMPIQQLLAETEVYRKPSAVPTLRARIFDLAFDSNCGGFSMP
jgi:hypothetical protein